MIELGVKPEVEIYDTGHLDMMLYLLHKGLLVEPLQVSFVMGVRGGMRGDPQFLSWLVRELPAGTSWQVIAVAKANLPMTTIGLAMGGNARTGMEDTLTLDKECRPSPTCSSSSASSASPTPCSSSRRPSPKWSSGSSCIRSSSTAPEPLVPGGTSAPAICPALLDTTYLDYMMPVSWEGPSVWWIAMEVQYATEQTPQARSGCGSTARTSVRSA